MGTRLQPYPLGDVYGGVGPDFPGTAIPNNVAERTDNWILSKDGLEFAKGWVKFTNQQLSTGASPDVPLEIIGYDQFFKNDGSVHLLCFTTRRAYYYNGVDLWIPITPVEAFATTVDVDSTLGTATLNVASTSGFVVNDRIIIHEFGVRQEEVVITAITPGVSLTVSPVLTFTHTAVQADSVKKVSYRSRVDSNSAALSVTLSVDNTLGYAVGEMILVGSGTILEEYLIIDAITPGVSFTVSRPSWAPSGTGLQFTHTAADNHTVVRMADLQYTTAADDVSSTTAENVFYYTSLAHPVMRWNGGKVYAEKLPGLLVGDSIEGVGVLSSDHKARYIFFFESFLVIANVEENVVAIPQKIRWSRFANYESWVNDVDGSGQAGSFLFFGSDFIKNMLQLKRELAIYRDNSIEAMSYLGPPDIMGFRRAETGTGLLASDGIVDLGDDHIFISPENIWEYNGINLVAIGDVIKNDFFTRLTPSQRSNIQMFHIKEMDDIWLTFSEDGENSHKFSYVYNTVFRKWSGPRDIDSTAFGKYTEQVGTVWDSVLGTWDDSPNIWDTVLFAANAPLNLMGNVLGYTFKLESGITKDGMTITATYDSKITDCGMPQVTKRLQRVKIGMREEGPIDALVYVGLATSNGDAVSFNGPYPLSLNPDGLPFIYVDLTARYFQIRIVTSATSNIRDLEMFFIPRVFR